MFSMFELVLKYLSFSSFRFLYSSDKPNNKVEEQYYGQRKFLPQKKDIANLNTRPNSEKGGSTRAKQSTENEYENEDDDNHDQKYIKNPYETNDVIKNTTDARYLSENNINKLIANKRKSFCSVYWNELCSNHLILRLFICKDITKHKFALALNFCLFYSLMFWISGMGYTDQMILNLYTQKNLLKLSTIGISHLVIKELMRIILTLFIPILACFIINMIIFVPENYYKEYKNIDQHPDNLKDFKQKYYNEMFTRVMIYGIIVLLFYLLSFIYSVSFCGVYTKTTVEYGLSVGICFSIHSLVIQPLWILIKSIIITCSPDSEFVGFMKRCH